jgi:hypothetical protein
VVLMWRYYSRRQTNREPAIAPELPFTLAPDVARFRRHAVLSAAFYSAGVPFGLWFVLGVSDPIAHIASTVGFFLFVAACERVILEVRGGLEAVTVTWDGVWICRKLGRRFIPVSVVIDMHHGTFDSHALLKVHALRPIKIREQGHNSEQFKEMVRRVRLLIAWQKENGQRPAENGFSPLDTEGSVGAADAAASISEPAIDERADKARQLA